MQSAAPTRVARAARAAAAAAPLAASSTAGSLDLPTSSTASSGPARSGPAHSHTAGAPNKKRARQRQDKPRLEGKWLPVLQGRSPRGRGCGHFVYGTPTPSTKIAAFDLDGTVIRPLGGKAFPKSSFDWEFCGPEVVPKLRATYRQGYSLLLISNQASSVPSLASDFRKKLPFVARKIGVPLRAFACFDFDEFRKPAPGMWHAFAERFNGGASIDYSASFYVGDAAGRPADHADTDRKFALNTGLRFLTPEQFFLGHEADPDWTLWGWHPHAYDHTLPPPPQLADPAAATLGADDAPEVVLLVGPPAVGKTAYAAQLEQEGYLVLRLPRDAAPAALEPALHAALTRPPSSGAPTPRGLIIDASLPTRRARARLLAAVRASAAPVRTRCVVWTACAGGGDGAEQGVRMGSDEDTREVVELGRHNAVFRLATGAGEGQGEGAAGLTPLREFEAWARCYEVPTLAEGFTTLTPHRFSFSPSQSGGVPLSRWTQWLADAYPGKAKKTGRVALRGADLLVRPGAVARAEER
ncbi:putative DNA 3'-phosphatase Tpp1 [Rhodotorula diobovata]|uniref:Putative DNA 3'-phosphatase Tpp1 n=1 Tax=Rhodotorula diobovata TaxID=5288 RepID=A0A5C5G691_9BASI|nr:putative DNA 3'-phosphatase Tpp1 [Rhodotorula diobovata]